MLQQLAHRVGSRVCVYNVLGGYPLPPGIPEGAWVVVLKIEPGVRVVEFEGRRFTVAMACVNPGYRVVRTEANGFKDRDDSKSSA